MSRERDSAELIVVGAGVIGLSVAWRAATRGMRVTVLERDDAQQASSRVAAGMLAPVSEMEFGRGGRRLLALGMRSAALWPAFASELEAASGEEVGLLATGTLMVARDADEARELERQIELRSSLGLRAMRLRASQARELEPALAPTIRLALQLPDDHSVEPRLVLAALRRACECAGVRLRDHGEVERVLGNDARVTGVQLQDGAQVVADTVVIAAGTWSGGLGGLQTGEVVPVRPVKGQTLRLRDPQGPGLLARPVRFEGGYVVPRADGRYVLGGTMEEQGFDCAPTAGAAYELLREGRELVPGISELEIEELCVGLRPGTPDNVPAVGRGAREGLVWATGHFRNGILLAPLTAELVLGCMGDGARDDALLQICDPARFSGQARPTAPRRTGAADARRGRRVSSAGARAGAGL
ncbi:MAG TPA: glycine oxidase ThiO [Solirubrobacteraceae bacterium]|jgi:glycine oxidase|nr:glycine oxidase ThiO [Solirubrobacteraceae bacterium]